MSVETRSLLLAVAAGVVFLSGAAFGQAVAKPDLAKAQQIASQVCVACHGPDGNSPSAANPNLAGQVAEYITRQLKHFKEGIRKNDVMTAMSASLSEEDMQALGVYYSRQKAKGGAASDAELAKAGQQIYRGGDLPRGLPACAGCHTPTGAGIPTLYPRLAGQYADYVRGQLKAYKDETRGGDKDGRDPYGHIMLQIAQKLTERDMRAVAEYVSGLR